MMASNSAVPHTVLLILIAALFCPFAFGKVIYVDKDAAGANNGSSWIDAYNFLQDALTGAYSAEKPVEIWVAQGTYKPDRNSARPNGHRNPRISFSLINGVSMYGGFQSGEIELRQRDPNLYETTLSGDLDENDASVSDPFDLLNEPNRAENSYHVVSSHTDRTAVLDGFVITGGNANTQGFNAGGGIYNWTFSSPTLTNCTFSGNKASSGGGMYNDTHCHPTLTNCTFSGNFAWDGGGMYNDDNSSPTLTKCTFSGNFASQGGGGMQNFQDCSPTLTNCTFIGNLALGNGGGMSNDHDSSPTLSGCTFSGNSAGSGGGMYNWRSEPILINCTFSGNSAEEYGSGRADYSPDHGGGMYNGHSHPRLSNCTFSDNSADGGGGMYNDNSSYPNVTNCTFSSNSAWDGRGGGISNSDNSQSTIINCTIAGNLQYGISGGFSEIRNSIIWVDSSQQIADTGANPSVSYSNVKGGFHGWSNIDIDPCFADANNGDYHLKSQAGRWDPNSQTWVQDNVASPCIDAGDPDLSGFHEPYPNGCVINMGAYGGTPEASLSPSVDSLLPPDHPDYETWIEVGQPLCWGYERQCYGDADCKAQGKDKYWVSTDDLDILIAAWNKTFAEIEGETVNTVPLICADFDHQPQGKNKYRVSTDDLDIFIANWNDADKPDPNCP